MNHTQHRLKGVLFAIIGATLWGLGGTVSRAYSLINEILKWIGMLLLLAYL